MMTRKKELKRSKKVKALHPFMKSTLKGNTSELTNLGKSYEVYGRQGSDAHFRCKQNFNIQNKKIIIQ